MNHIRQSKCLYQLVNKYNMGTFSFENKIVDIEKYKYSDELCEVWDYVVNVTMAIYPSFCITKHHLILAMSECVFCNVYKYYNNHLTDEELNDLTTSLIDNINSEGIVVADDITEYFLHEDLKKALEETQRYCYKSDKEKGIERETKLSSTILLYHILTDSNNSNDYQALKFSLADLLNIDVDDIVANEKKKSRKIHATIPYAKIGMEGSISVDVSNIPHQSIDTYTISLEDEICKESYDRLVGREEELDILVNILCRRKKNNAILVGPAGCGKTSIIYGLAERIHDGTVPQCLRNKKIVMLNVLKLVSGTTLRGMLEERVETLFSELKQNPNYILFLDDMQSVLKSTNKERDSDLTDVIGDVLSGGDVRIIGCIGFKDYRNSIERNSAICRKMQKMVIEPLNASDSLKVLQQNKIGYEKYHHVSFGNDILELAVVLAERYINSTCLPDSALDVLDVTGAKLYNSNFSEDEDMLTLIQQRDELLEKQHIAMDEGNWEDVSEIIKELNTVNGDIHILENKNMNEKKTYTKVTVNDIMQTVSNLTKIPVSNLSESDKANILSMEDKLNSKVIGQKEAVSEIVKAIKRSKAGFNDKSKVIASFLFISPTGCGKTLMAKEIARQLFGSESALIRFDMSEYQEKTDVNKFIGAAAGYVGYENGGLLTEAVKNKPYCVLLFDEIEKADESIYNLFLQLFDEGRLTDNNGQTINFKNVIVIMTSNVGAKQASEQGGGIGFNTDENENKMRIMSKSLRRKFSPEFLNRIDKIVNFNSLSDDTLKEIVGLELNKIVDRVKENGIKLKFDKSINEYIFNECIKEKEYGARPIMRLIQDNVSDKIVDTILLSEKSNKSYKISYKNNNVIVI